MAITIELWTRNGLVGGAEHWWDDVEVTLRALDPAQEAFPLLSRVDRYGDATFTEAELRPLREELWRLAATTPPRAVAAIADKVIELCDAGLAATASELRFVGD
ncbi:hypothetical protein [Nocardioides sp. 616]|uniref:hypothetical protein n=1 Tax=Nocardioides sp. 616 TaxID=2268090 RepID=UPI000CE2F040|nr:hypothetical protein [Nocardioides sp. 616]